MAQLVKYLPAMQETWVRSMGWEDPLEKGKATRSSILAWKIPWTEEPGGLQSMGVTKSQTRLSDKHLEKRKSVFSTKMLICQSLQHKCFSDKSDELSKTTNRVLILKLQSIGANEFNSQRFITLGLVPAVSMGCLCIVLLN